MNTPTPALTDADDRLEVALELAMRLGRLAERSNYSDDVEFQAQLQESIKWTREQLRAARRDALDAMAARINRLELEQLIERSAIQRVIEAWDRADKFALRELIEAIEGLRPGDEVTA